ncbi:MAG: UDP-N-acetylmuramoyl-L-alanyl-D-glutamate--2,6-diaminopimelate ligase [Clostridia bacterium]|nr:UDP-N-acetylmuramoyl-L-alanyl-D-glutamate--2,6-diaminopimelate ligase [Clostridia bacterium]
MKLNEIIYENEYITSDIDLSFEINSIATSPDEVGENCLFILENPNRMPSIKDFSQPPLAILSADTADFPNCIPAIKVENSRLMSALIHSRFFGVDFDEISVIGVTGTNGKTTTAYMIYTVLNENNVKAGFIGTGRIEIKGKKISDSYYSMTTPDPSKLYKVLKKMQDEGCTKIVMEVSSHALALDKVAPIPFEYGVFTNLSPEHTDFHSSMNDYFNTKLKLLNQAKNKVINLDDTYGRAAAKMFDKGKITIGAVWQGDYYATNIEYTEKGITYFTHSNKICYKTMLNFHGIYNVYNSLLASAVCIDMGIAPCLVKKSLSGFNGAEGRFEVIKGEIKAIIDYAHTEEAYNNVLNELKRLKGNRILTVVFGCGGERDKTKRAKIASLVEKYAERIIVTEDNSRNEDPEEIFSDIQKGFSQSRHLIIKDRKEAIKEAIFSSCPGDFVAVIGKGAEEYNLDKNGYTHFNDKEIVLSALKEYENKT